MAAGHPLAGFDRVLRVARVWPRIFLDHPSGTLPAAFEDDRLIVLCAAGDPLDMVSRNGHQIVRLLNRLLDGDVVVGGIEAIEASRAELLLARDLLALKSWLVDFDIGI